MSALRRGALVRLFQAALAIAIVCSASTPASAQPNAPYFEPTFNKVDSSGALLPGATFRGWSCSKFSDEPEWTCLELADAAWFGAALTASGTTADQWGLQIDSEPVGMCAVVVETRAPDGYQPAANPAVVACHGPQGWFTDPATLPDSADVRSYAPEDGFVLDGVQYRLGAGDWIITNNLEATQSTFSLTSRKIVRPTVTINKVDEKGNLLAGGVFEGAFCSKSDNDLSWQCNDLAEYPWFTTGQAGGHGLTASGSTGTSLSDDIPVREQWASSTFQCLALREKQPPAGYIASTVPIVVCNGPGGWTAENAAGIELPLGSELLSAGVGDWTVTNVKDTMTTTLQLVNRPIVKPTSTATVTPSPAVTAASVAPSRGIGANTGLDDGFSAIAQAPLVTGGVIPWRR